jgi:predicted TIM-barrel fold metal-dependent hydrolase
VELEMGMFRAYHRWLEEYCGAYPDRLGAAILVSGRDLEGSLAEIRKWGKSRWAWGILPYVPEGMPLDSPRMEPVWALAQEYDLAIALHTFTGYPPYAPGGEDNWDNMFLQRSAAFPWCGMRNMAAMMGAGIMDRYPKLRVGTLEAGHGWLPFWLKRIDEHAHTVKKAIPDIKYTPSEYVAQGRYFQSIEVHEGGELTNAVADLLGDQVLMYASDFPHGESRFPETVDLFLGWKMDETRRRKMLWENALKYYPRCGLT